jgi:hypothetical protein
VAYPDRAVKCQRRHASKYALLGSIAVHTLLTLGLATYEPSAHPAPRAPLTLEFTVTQPIAAATVSAPDAERRAEPARTALSEPRSAARERTLRAPAPAPAPSETESGSVQPESDPPAAAATGPVTAPRAPQLRDLSPLAAALTLRDSLGTGRCEAALSDAAAGCGEGTGDAGLAAHASASEAQPAELIALRKELQLKPQSDGSYLFKGPSFVATVAVDGRVTFEDKIADLNSFVEHRLVGAQINTSEKRRFMESTALLRERLAVAAEAQNQRRASVALRQALRRILADARTSLLQKRRTFFDLWDDCASDASGSAAQTVIETFIREHLPEGSALGYSAGELAQLNLRRISRRPFDPYAAPDAGPHPG